MKYIIDEETLIKLIANDWELTNLYNYGVDNWEGYGEIDEDDKFTKKDVTDYIKENFELLEILDKENNKIKEVMSVEELEEYEPKNMVEQEYQDWFWE